MAWSKNRSRGSSGTRGSRRGQNSASRRWQRPGTKKPSGGSRKGWTSGGYEREQRVVLTLPELEAMLRARRKVVV